MSSKKQKVFFYLLLFSFPFLLDFFFSYLLYGRPPFLRRIYVSLNSDRLDVFLGEISSIQIRILGSKMRVIPVIDEKLVVRARESLKIEQPRYLPILRENPKVSIEFSDETKKGSGSFFLFVDEGPFIFFQVNGTEAPNSPKYDGRWIYFRMTPDFRKLAKEAIFSVIGNSDVSDIERETLRPLMALL